MNGATAQRGAAGLHHRVADHAASGALRDLLAHHRLSYAPEPLSEGTIFGLSGALDLSLRIGEAARPVIELDGRTASLEIDLCRHLGMPSQWCETDDPAAGWEILSIELKEGRPTVLRADVAELDYHPERRHDTRHAIVVTGYDAQAGTLSVLDGRFPDPQRCTLAALAAARASCACAAPVRHGLLRLTPGPRLAEPRQAITAAVSRVVRSMRRARNGLGAIDALASVWPRLPEITGSCFAQTLVDVRLQIRDSATGGALCRSLQARFEHDAAAMLGSPKLGQAALVCDDLVDAWRTFASALDDEDAVRAHTVARPWLERIRTLEHRHVEGLEAQLATGDRAPI